MPLTSRPSPTRGPGPEPPDRGARAWRPLAAVLIVPLAVLLAIWLGARSSTEPSDTAEVAAEPTTPPRATAAEVAAEPTTPPRATAAEVAPADEAAPRDGSTSATSSARIGEMPAVERTPPVALRIPAIGLDGPVVEVGARDGAFDVLDGVGEIGWYGYGPSPGEPGSAVLAAHVDTARDGAGLFFDLDQLDGGEPVEVVLDDGTTAAFEVVAIERYRKQELPVDALFARSGEPRLVLITCGGAFDPVLRRYEDNVVVTAALRRAAA